MNVIGLDLSLSATGVCHADGVTQAIKVKTRGMERLADIRNLVDHYTLGTDLIVIEGYAMGTARQAGTYAIGELGGVIRLHLFELGRRYIDISPATLKKYATGKGNAKKVDMAVAAMKRANLEFRDDNQCDAWWLRQAGICWLLDNCGMADPAMAPQDYVPMPAENRKNLPAATENEDGHAWPVAS